jgi:hypothetical protein
MLISGRPPISLDPSRLRMEKMRARLIGHIADLEVLTDTTGELIESSDALEYTT